MQEFDRAVARVAAAQHGLVTRRQILGRLLGSDKMIEYRCRTGLFVPLHRGVYRTPFAPRTWKQGVLAACLLYDPRARASHRTAAALFGLADVKPSGIELIVPRGMGTRRPGLSLYGLAGSLQPSDRAMLDGIPVTAVARTLFDLAVVEHPDIVEEAVHDAVARKLVTQQRLRWQLGKLATCGRPGIRVMRAILRDRRMPESVRETRGLRLLRRAGVSGLVPQYKIRDQRGALVARVDIAIPDARLAIEVDSERWHSSPDQIENDTRKRALMVAHGWLPLAISTRMIEEQPDEVVELVTRTAALRRLGGEHSSAVP